MTGAFEFIFTCFPIGRTAQMGAARINDEEPFCVADHPNAIIFLELCVHAETEIGWVANSENGFGLVQRPGEEEPQEHEKISSQEPQDTGGYNSPPARHCSQSFSFFKRRQEFRPERREEPRLFCFFGWFDYGGRRFFYRHATGILFILALRIWHPSLHRPG